MAGCPQELKGINEKFQNIQKKVDKMCENTSTLASKVAKQTSSGGGPKSLATCPRGTGGGNKWCLLRSKVTKIIIPPRSIVKRVEGTHTGDMVDMPQAKPPLTKDSVYIEYNKRPPEIGAEIWPVTIGANCSIGEIRTDGSSTFVYPGSNYTGPGNALDGSEPVNEIDAVAKRHDEEYHRIQYSYRSGFYTRDEANRKTNDADAQMMAELKRYKPKDLYELYHSSTAGFGIATKMIFEKLLGTGVYPNWDRPRDWMDSRN